MNYMKALAAVEESVSKQSTPMVIAVVKNVQSAPGDKQSRAIVAHAAKRVLTSRFAETVSDWTIAERIAHVAQRPNVVECPVTRCMNDAISQPLTTGYWEAEDAAVDHWQIHGDEGDDGVKVLAAFYAAAAHAAGDITDAEFAEIQTTVPHVAA